jgi:hypothetical protein
MKNRELWIILALIAGFFLAVIAFRRVHRHPSPASGRIVPPGAQPRYIGFGEFYDPYAIWPYGSNSNYSLFLDTNSGVPTTEVYSPGYRSVGTAPANPILGNGSGGVGIGPGMGGGVGGGRGN